MAKKSAVKKVKSKKSNPKSLKKTVVRKSKAGAGSAASKGQKKKASVKATAAVKAGTAVTSMVGKSVPTLVLPATGQQNLSLKDFSGKKIVLYFYPKDNTPGCTVEGSDFKRLMSAFASAGAVVLGVSKDSLKSHENFKSKFDFGFDLISDEKEELCQAFGVIQMKSMYGKQYLGIDRSTFVIDSSGKVIHEWRKVKVPGHAEEVLEFLKTLKAS